MKNINNFAAIMHTFEGLANNPNADPDEYAASLIMFGRACARSVLKKVIDPKAKERSASDPTKWVIKDKLTDAGHNPLLVNMLKDIFKDEKTLDAIAYANEFAFECAFNSNGDYERDIVNSDLANALDDMMTDTLGDGLDLVNDAVVAILEEMQKQREREPSMFVDFERVYNKRVLNRKVWIKETDGAQAWKTIETSPIKEVYKHIRRAIESSRAVQCDPKNGYMYLEDLVYDDDAEPTTVYRRLPKYADLGGSVTDFNGKETAMTADNETIERYYSALDALNLTDRQAQILKYRMQGYGYKAIGTKLGVSHNAIVNAVNKVKAKAEKIGFTPAMWSEMSGNY